MNVRERNLKLAQEILTTLKKKIKSSNDILPKSSLPHFNPEGLTECQKLNSEQFDELMVYMRKFNLMREIAQAVLSKLNVEIPDFVGNAAVAQFGVGENEEITDAAILELLKQNSSKNISRFEVYDPHYPLDHHSFILLGHTQGLDPSDGLVCLKSLDDHCILLDPFLNVVCQANQYDQNDQIKKYHSAFSMSKAEIQYFDHLNQEKVSQFKKEMDEIYRQMMGLLLIMQIKMPNKTMKDFIKEQKPRMKRHLRSYKKEDNHHVRQDKPIHLSTYSPSLFQNAKDKEVQKEIKKPRRPIV